MATDNLQDLLPSFRIFTKEELDDGSYLHKEPDYEAFNKAISNGYNSLKEAFEAQCIKLGIQPYDQEYVATNSDNNSHSSSDSQTKHFDKSKSDDKSSYKHEPESLAPKESFNIDDASFKLSTVQGNHGYAYEAPSPMVSDVSKDVALDPKINQNDDSDQSITQGKQDNHIELDDYDLKSLCTLVNSCSSKQDSKRQENHDLQEQDSPDLSIKDSNDLYASTSAQDPDNNQEQFEDPKSFEQRINKQLLERISLLIAPYRCFATLDEEKPYQKRLDIVTPSGNSYKLIIFYKASLVISSLKFNKTSGPDSNLLGSLTQLLNSVLLNRSLEHFFENDQSSHSRFNEHKNFGSQSASSKAPRAASGHYQSPSQGYGQSQGPSPWSGQNQSTIPLGMKSMEQGNSSGFSARTNNNESLDKRIAKILEPLGFKVKFFQDANYQKQYQVTTSTGDECILMIFYKANNKISSIRFNKVPQSDKNDLATAVLQLNNNLKGTEI